MDETPSAEHPGDAARADAASGVSRRAVLVGGGFLVATAAGAGVAAAALRPLRPVGQAHPPAELEAALAAEDRLIAVIDASLAAEPGLRTALAAVRADHAAHAATLRAVVSGYPAGPAPQPTTAPPRALGQAALAAAERAAAAQAARRGAVLRGPTAALLASIAACEASHAELLT